MLAVTLIAFLILLVIGVPISFTMGLAPILGISTEMSNVGTLAPQRMFVGVDSFTLLAIPLFMLAGVFMETGGISRRLVNFSYSLVGHISGGLGMSSVMTSVIFAGVSGSAAADTAAVGSVMIPAMKEKRYPVGLAATLQACAGSLGPIIPPSLTMILYATICNVSISGLFMAGIIPGLLMGLAMMILTYYYGRKYNLKEEQKLSLTNVLKTGKEAFWALIMPIVILGGIITGIFTPTEAGVIAVLYAFVVGLFIYKEFKWKDLPRIFIEAAGGTSMVMLMIAGASVLGWIVAYGKLPLFFVNMIIGVTNDPILVLLLIIAFIMFLGLFVETIAATIIVSPLLAPVVTQFGFDPIHFGFVIVAVLVFASITPPVGGILNITMGIGRCKMKDLMPFITPYVGVMFLVVLLVVFFPGLATFLPGIFL